MREEPVAPHEIDPAIPVFIERAILKCLQKDPGRRYQSVAELQTALRSTTGTGYPTAALAPAGAASLRTSRTTDASTVAVPATLLPAAPKSKRSSPIVWLLLGAFAVLVMLAGLSALARMKSANSMAPPPLPAELSAPTPPVSAFRLSRPVNTSAETGAAAPHHAKAASANTQPSVPVVFPHVEFGKKASRQNRPGASAPVYLWVGRFQREAGAQNAAKRIEDDGLPVVVMPRRNQQNGQQFFVVFTGPFAPTRAQDIVQRLEEQGFSNVHEVKPGQNQKQNPNK